MSDDFPLVSERDHMSRFMPDGQVRMMESIDKAVYSADWRVDVVSTVVPEHRTSNQIDIDIPGPDDGQRLVDPAVDARPKSFM
ncbi:MAG TPA: hypothetical protein VG266_00970 [Candidatus Dormibacteraeota bacterium]|nr:hypothetical protein [Candidatus Dormibacteraeota bacterium]